LNPGAIPAIVSRPPARAVDGRGGFENHYQLGIEPRAFERGRAFKLTKPIVELDDFSGRLISLDESYAVVVERGGPSGATASGAGSPTPARTESVEIDPEATVKLKGFVRYRHDRLPEADGRESKYEARSLHRNEYVRSRRMFIPE
jgi:hypothetical protein